MGNWEQFQEKYSSASDEVRAFIDSESIPDFAEQMKSDYALTASIGSIITHVSDAALALQTPVDAVKGMAATDQLPAEKQTELTQKLTTFLQENIPNFSAPETPVSQQATIPTAQQQSQTPVLESETEPETPSIPRYARPLTDTPRYNDNNQ